MVKAWRLIVGGLLLGLLFLAAPPVGAQSPYAGYVPPSLGPNIAPAGSGTAGSGTAGSAVDAEVLAVRLTSPDPVTAAQARVGGLAFTGADVVSLVAVAGALILLGVVFVRRGRAGSPSQPQALTE